MSVTDEGQLCDMYAGLAMVGLVTRSTDPFSSHEMGIIARAAFKTADAMIQERNNRFLESIRKMVRIQTQPGGSSDY
jgi:hypothetical protein